MSYGRRVRVGARVRVGVQGVDVCLRPGRWCVKYRQARRRLGIRAGAVAVAVAVAAAAVTYESPSVACDAHTLPRLSRMCARCESRRAGQGEGGDTFLCARCWSAQWGWSRGRKLGRVWVRGRSVSLIRIARGVGPGRWGMGGGAGGRGGGGVGGGGAPCQLAGSRLGKRSRGQGRDGSWAVSGECSSRSQRCLTALIISLPPGPGLPEVPGMLMSSSTSCQSVVSWIAAITSSAQLTSFTLKSSLPPKRLLAAAKSASKASRWNCSSSARSTLRTPAVPRGSPFDDKPGIDRAGADVRVSSTKPPTSAADAPASSG